MKTELVLDRPFQKAWERRDPFEEVKRLEGEVFRAQQSRLTLRFDFAGRSWFLKRHGAVSWKEIAKNLAVLKLPVVSARNEWRALARLRELGIDTLTPAAYGRRGLLPSAFESFLITGDLGRLHSLEDICAAWPHQTPAPAHKRRLLARVAGIARRMHQGGVCHRDFYICHFLQDDENPERLYLIDLHRALIRKRLRRRWIVKDIGGLYFSAMDIGLTARDLLRFMKHYSGKDLRTLMREEEEFWRDVRERAIALKMKHS